jgi:hypothetical protein
MLTEVQFKELCEYPVQPGWEFGCNGWFVWAYDPETDIHYFFK